MSYKTIKYVLFRNSVLFYLNHREQQCATKCNVRRLIQGISPYMEKWLKVILKPVLSSVILLKLQAVQKNRNN